jgi:hypothetical protein
MLVRLTLLATISRVGPRASRKPPMHCIEQAGKCLPLANTTSRMVLVLRFATKPANANKGDRKDLALLSHFGRDRASKPVQELTFSFCHYSTCVLLHP